MAVKVYRDPIPGKPFGFMVQLGDVRRMAKAVHVELTDDVAHGVVTHNLPTQQHVASQQLDERQLQIGLDVIDAIEASLRLAGESPA
ncbi:hypothetical protein [Streptomyces antarcticus]|uniref:hypothetical protein n=1 Tax=Streptomyces antarcticus TaxID=2996458 RepID=UPI00226F8C16|nr:hypothetical protein [Streptomyces sp. H34-AA3]MCY0947926.1 hypothetical protein [Streptomyces sp. H34-AA3]